MGVNGRGCFVVRQYTDSVTQRRVICDVYYCFISEYKIVCSTEGFLSLWTPIWERSTVKMDVTNLKVGFLMFKFLLNNHSVGCWIRFWEQVSCYGSWSNHYEYVFYRKKSWLMLQCFQKLSARIFKALIQGSRCITVIFAVNHENSFTWNHTCKSTFLKTSKSLFSNWSWPSLCCLLEDGL